MYARHDRVTEVAGFALLRLAAIWDWRPRRGAIAAIPDDAREA